MSNSDLTQYNGAAAWVATANVGTASDPYLVPTDFKQITAFLNAMNQAPVNVALSKAKDLIIGLRGATIGDFAGAVPRTFKSLEVDSTGGAVSGATDGDIWASAGNLIAAVNSYADGAFLGQLACVIGVYAAATLSRQTEAALQFEGTGTGANDSNPPLATSVKNQLRAKNATKCWGYVSIQSGTVNAVQGWGNWTAATTNALMGKVVGDRLRLTLNDAMDDIYYSVQAIVRRTDGSNPIVTQIMTDTITTGLVDIGFWNLGKGGAAPPYGDWNTWAFDGTFEVLFTIDGKQTT